jgi:hypothetical protein
VPITLPTTTSAVADSTFPPAFLVIATLLALYAVESMHAVGHRSSQSRGEDTHCNDPA